MQQDKSLLHLYIFKNHNKNFFGEKKNELFCCKEAIVRGISAALFAKIVNNRYELITQKHCKEIAETSFC